MTIWHVLCLWIPFLIHSHLALTLSWFIVTSYLLGESNPCDLSNVQITDNVPLDKAPYYIDYHFSIICMSFFLSVNEKALYYRLWQTWTVKHKFHVFLFKECTDRLMVCDQEMSVTTHNTGITKQDCIYQGSLIAL